MIKNNLLGQILIGLLVLFLLIGSLQMFGIGQNLSTVEIDEDNLMNIPVLPSVNEGQNQDANLNTKDLVSNITNRPIFSDSRTPFVSEPDPTEGGENIEEPVEISSLNAQLTGVVITPEQSYAMILDNNTNQRETYKIGMPLDGEQGGWTLTEIHKRKVVFVSDDEKSEELELAVYSESLKSGGAQKKAGRNRAQTQQQAQKLTREDKKKNADDIRKKIAERRAQMRAEAAKKK